MRDRVKGFEPGDLQFSVYDYVPPSGWPVNPVTWTPGFYFQPKGYSHLTDKVGHGFWNPAHHVRCNFLPGSLGAWPQRDFDTLVASQSGHLFTVEDAEDLAAASFDAARGSAYETWVSHLYQEFTDQFPDQFSIANSLLELRNGVKEFLPTMDDLKARISSDYLKIKFGIEPFIQDLIDSVTVYGKFKQRLKFLNEHKVTFRDRKKMTSDSGLLGRFVLRDMDVSGAPPPTPHPPGLYGPKDPGGMPIDYQVQAHQLREFYTEDDVKTEHVATAFIENQLKGLDNVSRQVDAMAGMCGLNNLPKIAWKATPWTWLAEWFVDVDNILEAFEYQPFEGKLALNAVYLSTKIRIHANLTTECIDHGTIPGSSIPGQLLMRLYDRSDELEISESLITPRLIPPNLSGSQQAILLALLHQRCKAVPDIVELFHKWRNHR